jgi:hypothetical protein
MQGVDRIGGSRVVPGTACNSLRLQHLHHFRQMLRVMCDEVVHAPPHRLWRVHEAMRMPAARAADPRMRERRNGARRECSAVCKTAPAQGCSGHRPLRARAMDGAGRALAAKLDAQLPKCRRDEHGITGRAKGGAASPRPFVCM